MAERGRPEFVPTNEQRATVKSMVSVGIQQDKIAKVIGISKPTLEKHFEHEIETAAADANHTVAMSLYDQATQGNVTAAIWWTKARMGWSEKNTLEHTGPGGGPMQITEIRHVIIDPKADGST